MKIFELKQMIRECIDEIIAEEEAFENSAINENNLLERWNLLSEGPARRHRRSSGEHQQDFSTKKGNKDAYIRSWVRKAGRGVKDDQFRGHEGDYRLRHTLPKRLGEEKKYHTEPPKAGQRKDGDRIPTMAVKKKSPSGRIISLARKLSESPKRQPLNRDKLRKSRNSDDRLYASDPQRYSNEFNKALTGGKIPSSGPNRQYKPGERMKELGIKPKKKGIK